jgi:starch-binding outer membrane protein, SusD/RagB family
MIMKYIKLLIGILLVTGIITSCSDFLNEEETTRRNTDYLKTEEGIRDLSVGLYYSMRIHFSGEHGFATTNYGTDEFRCGGDASNAVWDAYDGGFTSMILPVNVNTTMAETLFDNMYIGINSANLLLKNANLLLDFPNKNTFMGEAHFLRAYNYLKLVRQYGGVPLKLEPSDTPEREFTRASAEEIVAQVISDFEEAFKLLPAEASLPGKMTKDAAAHFLAKAYLFRASEINDSWNSSTKNADLARALVLAEGVIANRKLAPNFADLWNYNKPNGDNEKLNEIIFAVQFSDKTTSGRYGNQMHLFYLSQYSNLPQMRRDIAGGREYQRLRTNYYAWEVFDLVNDSRFWKSFKTKNAVNNPAVGSVYQMGDLSIMYILNKANDTRFSAKESLKAITDPTTGKIVPSVFAAYAEDEKYLDRDNFQNRFPSLNKYIDGSRETFNEVAGNRDGVLARLADTYLTAAEICIRQNNYPKALEYINIVRARGAYKDGEDRKAYIDGAAAYNQTANPIGYNNMGATISFYPENSYYESNNIPVSSSATSLTVTSFANLPAEDEAIIQKLGYTSEYDRALCFLLNERSRELIGEFHRWEDLSRTKTLVARTKAFNKRAAPNIQDKHNIRPIPQAFLDAIQKNGRALTSEEKSAMQNTGY